MMRRPKAWRIAWAGAISIGLLLCASCADERRMVGQTPRHVEVQTVTDAGVTLDPSASPKAVIYVLLQAIRDDFAADGDAAMREAAFDRQLALCAPDTILRRSAQPHLGRDEVVRRIVWHWAPTLGYYREDFPPDLAAAMSRIRVEDKPGEGYDMGQPGEQWAYAFLQLADPGGDPHASVIAQFQLAREANHWRIVQLGFARTPRAFPDMQSTIPG